MSALLKEKNNIIKRYRYSFCCDEVFLQTFVFEHKEFLNRIYCPNDQYKSCMRYIDFKRGNPYIFNIKDMEELYKADRFCEKSDNGSYAKTSKALILMVMRL